MDNVVLDIAVEKVSFSADKLYKYKTGSATTKFQIGQRVIVPFGLSNSKRCGVVFGVHKNSDIKHLKSIHMVLDTQPCISFNDIELIKWMKDRYFCTYFEAIHSILPSGIGGKITDIHYIINKDLSNKMYLNETEKNFLNLLSLSGEKIISLKKIINLKISNYSGILTSLIEKDIMKEQIDFKSPIGNKNAFTFSLSDQYSRLRDTIHSRKQKELCEFLVANGVSNFNKINYYTGISKNVVENLVKKGIIIKSKISNYSPPEASDKCTLKYEHHKTPDNEYKIDIQLNNDQEFVFKEMIKNINNDTKIVSLLHGVTGSGKTAILLKLIDYVISNKKSAIFMIPEISLTSQFIEIFKLRYKNLLGIIHSNLTKWQRYDIWKKIKNGEIKVVLGTRSAVFAPLKDIGIIIVDEEHEFTYKSDFAPRYDAREVAIKRCELSGGKVILSSATPSIESYYNAKSNKYNLLKLSKTYSSLKCRKIEIVDMNTCEKIDKYGNFSKCLIENLEITLSQKKQSILLINRRGYNFFVKCDSCTKILMCPNCSVPLAYHEDNKKLMCHYCGYCTNKMLKCPNCSANNLIYIGSGTQKIEKEIQEFFPSAKILRLDSDVKNTSNCANKNIIDFQNGKYDIIIGTQMVSKGFNFPNVVLAGIVNIDQYLYSDDFKSTEKTFSLIAQLVGRVGRFTHEGKAIIQTYFPENDVINLASHQDYDSFFNNEIKYRKSLLNPPFSDICYLVFSGKDNNYVRHCTKIAFNILKDIARKLYSEIPLRIFPPSEAKINKISNNYIHRIMIKCKNSIKSRTMINMVLVEYSKNKLLNKIKVYSSMNPDSIL